MRYLVVYEQAPENWSACAPDVPGCVATGETREEAQRLIREALAEHLGLLAGDRMPFPEPSAVWAEGVDVEPAEIVPLEDVHPAG